MFPLPDGNCNKQLQQMKLKATKYGELLSTAHIYHHEAWIGLTSMTPKSIEYALPATTLTKSECNELCGY